MLVYFVCYVTSFVLARQHFYILSRLILTTTILWLYYRDYAASRNVIHLQGLFCLFFVGGQGIFCFKLSRLQGDWSVETRICLGLAVATFWAVFEALTRLFDGWSADDMESAYRFYASAESPFRAERFLRSIAGLVAVSYAAFFFEAWRLGFVPLFSCGVPHAYSHFHVNGVHYFTTSCVLALSLSVVYGLMVSRRGRGLSRDRGFWLGTVYVALALVVPALCVSRFQLILAVGMAAFTYISMAGNVRPGYMVILFGCMVPAYLALTVMRSHSVEYLDGIFEMKNSHIPIFITQPYMYIANNYDNFDCLVEQLPSHTLGLRMLFPVWTLAGLKFLVPSLVNFPLSVTEKELTTLTPFYDTYYDFGVVGMMLLGALLRTTCYYLVEARRNLRCPTGHVFYAQIAVYMILSSFTTWFSNPTTWFCLVVTGIIYICVRS